MRGPMVRIQSDIRRLWRCPKCNYERQAHATQTTVQCHCEKDAPFMHLVETKRRARTVPEELPQYFEFEEEEDVRGTESAEQKAIQPETETSEASQPSASNEEAASNEEETPRP